MEIRLLLKIGTKNFLYLKILEKLDSVNLINNIVFYHYINYYIVL